MGKEKRTSCCLSLVYRRVLYSFWFRSPLPVTGEDLPYLDTSSSERPEDASPYRRRLSTGPIPVPRCRKTSTTLPEIPDVRTTPSISLPIVSSYDESPSPSCTAFAPFYPSSFAPILRLTVPPFFEEAPLCYLSEIFFSVRLLLFMAGPVPWRSPSKRPKEGPLWPSGRLGHAYHLPITSTFDIHDLLPLSQA